MGKRQEQRRDKQQNEARLESGLVEKGGAEILGDWTRSSAAGVRLVLQGPARPARLLLDPRSEQAQVR